MSSMEYAVYGITEPYTNNIVFIGYYVYDWSDMEKYPDKEDYVDDAIYLMQGEDTPNGHWRDLDNMYNRSSSKIGVVVLDSVKNEKDAQYAVDYFRDLFKPRYNTLINKCKCDEDCCSNINCQCSCGKNIRF